jgi:uracil-DNA glycosylase
VPEDLQTLKSKMRACTLCKGLELGPGPIFQLDDCAKILIVGQAPGRLTHAKDRPFDDPSGVRLRSWLGVDQSTFYNDKRIGTFPMALCFPGSGSGGDKPPRAECAET